MKKILAIALVAASITTITSQVQAQVQAYSAPIDITLGYANNKALGSDGARIELGTEVKDVRFGLTSLTSDERMEAYGAFASLPIQISETKLSIVPRAEVEKYRVADEIVGSLGIGAEYQMTQQVRADATYKYSKSFDSAPDIEGNTFMFGLTRTF